MRMMWLRSRNVRDWIRRPVKESKDCASGGVRHASTLEMSSWGSYLANPLLSSPDGAKSLLHQMSILYVQLILIRLPAAPKTISSKHASGANPLARTNLYSCCSIKGSRAKRTKCSICAALLQLVNFLKTLWSNSNKTSLFLDFYSFLSYFATMEIDSFCILFWYSLHHFRLMQWYLVTSFYRSYLIFILGFNHLCWMQLVIKLISNSTEFPKIWRSYYLRNMLL
jgi:hypothetical protein